MPNDFGSPLDSPSLLMSPQEQILEQARQLNKHIMHLPQPQKTSNPLMDFLSQIPTAALGLGPKMPGHTITGGVGPGVGFPGHMHYEGVPNPGHSSQLKWEPGVKDRLSGSVGGGLEVPANINIPQTPFGKNTNYRFDPNWNPPELSLAEKNAAAEKRHTRDLVDYARHSGDNVADIKPLIDFITNLPNKPKGPNLANHPAMEDMPLDFYKTKPSLIEQPGASKNIESRWQTDSNFLDHVNDNPGGPVTSTKGAFDDFLKQDRGKYQQALVQQKVKDLGYDTNGMSFMDLMKILIRHGQY